MNKSLILFLIIFSMICQGCSQEEETIGGVPRLDISESQINFDSSEKSSASFVLRSTRDWVATCDEPWVALTQTSGKASNESISITVFVTRNEGMQRDAEIIFTNNRVTKSLNIRQRSK